MTEIHHPTTAPAAEPVDYFTWNRDFHGIRPRDTEDERPARLSTGVARVALAIAAHVNGKTGEATVGARRLAQSAQVSTGTVAKALPILESLGWFTVERSKRAGTSSDATNTYHLTSPVAALHKARGASQNETGVSHQMRQGVSPNEDELRLVTTFSTTRDEKTSVIAGAPTPKSVDNSMRDDRRWRDGEETAEPMPLHPEWVPNNASRAVAAKLGLNVEATAEAFRRAMNAWGQRRTEWGQAFTAYLKDEAKGDASNTFVAVEDDDVASLASDAGVQAMQAALSATETAEDPWAGIPETPAVEVADEATLVDFIEAEVVELAGPGVAGYSPAVEVVITRAEGVVRADGGDYFTRDERVMAAELAQQGLNFSDVAAEIDQHRARAAVRVASQEGAA